MVYLWVCGCVDDTGVDGLTDTGLCVCVYARVCLIVWVYDRKVESDDDRRFRVAQAVDCGEYYWET